MWAGDVMTKDRAPRCYRCVFREDIPGDCHSRCTAENVDVEGHPFGVKNGWFSWPHNFDPVWLLSCNGFEGKEGE